MKPLSSPFTSNVGRYHSRSSAENAASPPERRRSDARPERFLTHGKAFEIRAFAAADGPDRIVIPRHRGPAVLVADAGEYGGQGVAGVHHRAAVGAGVQVRAEAVDVDLGVDDASQPGRNARQLRGEHPGVADEHRIAGEPVGVLAEERRELR